LERFETRKLAAILAADIIGFSRLIGAGEDRALPSQPSYQSVIPKSGYRFSDKITLKTKT
jgi:hypothetical protein